MRDLSCWVKELSHRLSLLLSSCPEARGPRDRCQISALPSAHRAQRACLLPVVGTHNPTPSPGRSPAPGWGGCRSGRGPPPRREGPIRRCNLRRRVTRSAVGAAGWRYRLPAWTPGSRLRAPGSVTRRPQAARPCGPRRPASLRQARHAGPRREREPRTAGRAALHRRVRGGPLRERRAHAQFWHLPAGAARRRGLQHFDA